MTPTPNLCHCRECTEADEWFVCETCKKPTPQCMGAADEYPDDCDNCAVEKFEEIYAN